jgi:FecR protein
MRGWRRPALAWLALAAYLAPAPALAQATKAGVVTTLEGNVTAVRVVAPQPVALKFKDDVFLQDRVVTGEQSFARLLLGGKAVVSIRERSAVTITEIPGRSTIDVENGKIALSVARDRMQPGEVINIKMPNAVAGVRGTVVIAEVSYAMVGGAQQAISDLAVLRGQVEAVHTNAAGAPIGVPVMVGAMQKFSATPATASTGTFTVEQIGGIVQGLQSKGAADPGTASQAPARLEAVNTAVALLTALTGASGTQTVQHLATGTSPEITTPNSTKVEVKITEAGDITSSPVVPGGGPLPQLRETPPAPMNMTLSSGQSLLTITGNQVQSSDGTPIIPTTAPLVTTTGFTITQQGTDDLVVVRSDASIPPLPGTLMKLTGTTVQAGHAFLSVAGSVTSTSSQPFIDLDPTFVTTPGNFAEVIGPSAVLGLLAGGLVRDMGGTMNVGGSVVAVSEGGTLTSTGTGALVQLNGTTMTASSLLSVVGSGSSANLKGTLLATQGGSLTTLARGLGGGDLLRASAATVNLGGTLLDSLNTAVSLAGAVATLNNGSHLVQETGPFVRVRGGSLNADALLRADGLGNTFAFTGTVLDLTDTNARLGMIADFPDQGTDGATLLLAPGEPAARVTRSALRIDRGPFVSLVSAAETGCSQCVGVGTFAGVALISTGTAAAPSAITVADELVALGTVDFIGSSPIAQLTRTTVRQSGDGSVFISWFPDSTFGTRSSTKPLLMATDSNLDVPGRAIFQFGGARLVAATGGAPFLSLTNTLVNAGWLVDAQSGQLEVAGPLAAFSGGNSAIAGALLRIQGGASVITSAATPAVSIAGGTHQFGWVFDLDKLDTADMTEESILGVRLQLGTNQPLRQDSGVLQAPLLSVSNATIDAATGLRLDTVQLDTFSRLFDFTNSTVTGGSLGFIDLARNARLLASIPDAGLVNLFHSSMTLTGSTTLTGAALARVRGGSLLQIGTSTAAGSLVSVAGGSTVTLLTNVPVLSVAEGSVAQIFGSLIAFVGIGNTVVIDNNLCRNVTITCSIKNGVRLALANGAQLSSVGIETNPISGPADNKLTIGDDDALILISGADSRLLIAGTGADVPEKIVDDDFVIGQTLKTFSGISNRAGTSPVILITGRSIVVESTLAVVDSGADATLQAGPLMKVSDSTLDNISHLLLVQGNLTSLGNAPLIDLDPVTVNAQMLVEVGVGGKLSLAGPLLTDLNGIISTREDAIVVAGSLMSTGPNTLVGFQGTRLNVGTTDSRASLVSVTGSMGLAGPLLLASAGSTLTMTDVIGLFGGASVVREAGSPETAFIGIDASRLEVGRNANAAAGVTNVDGSVANITGVGGTSGTTQSSLTLNSGGALLEAKNGAFVDVRGANGNVIRLDAALLDATAPVIALIGASTQLQTSSHAINVNNNSTVESRSSDAFIKLESQARMDVLAGHLVNLSASKLNVAGDLVKVSASRLNVAGDLVRMNNAATLTVNGLLLNILGGSTVNINGALVSFLGNGNTINITNNILPTTFISGIPVSIAQGASVSIAPNSLAGLNTNGKITINNVLLPNGATSASGSLIKVDVNGTLRIGPPS